MLNTNNGPRGERPVSKMAEPAAIWHGLVGATTGALAALFAARHASASAAGAALDAALPIGGDATTAPLTGAWVAATGVVAADAPLESLNKDRAAVVQEVVSLRTLSVQGGGSLRQQTRVLSRDTRDVPWGLRVADGGVVGVERDAVRLAYARAPSSVQDLSPGGMQRIPPPPGGLAAVVKALWGVVEEESVREHLILPLGVTATVVGRLTAREASGAPGGGRALSLGLHPAWGLYLLRTNDVPAAAAGFRGEARWWGLAAGLFGAAAAWQAWKCALALAPGLQPLRRMLAGACRDALGVRLRSWEALENPYHHGHHGGSGSAGGAAGASSRRGSGGADGGGGGELRLRPGEVHPGDVPAPAGVEDAACVACLERAKRAVLLPCGHMCLCLTCAYRLAHDAEPRSRRCPMCRGHIDSAVRVYGGDAAVVAAAQAVV